MAMDPSALSPEKRALLAALLKKQGAAPAPAGIPRRDPSAPAPLSFAQERLWFLEQMEPGGAAYVLPAAWRLTGALNVAALQSALSLLVARHEALRTVFRAESDGPVQAVLPPSPIHLAVDDLSALDADGREAEVSRRVRMDGDTAFQVAGGPLFRASLLRLGDEEHVLLLALHHAIADGWSLGVLYRELSAAYAAALRGEDAALPPLAVRYADYAAWQRAELAGDALAPQLAYWRARLAGAPARLELPTDRARGAGAPGTSVRARAVLPRDAWEGVEALARRENATPYMVLLAAFHLLLGRYAGQDDVVVGSPVAGRTRAETEGLVGFFINSIAVRGDLSGDPTFRALLGRVREAALGAFVNQDVPFDVVVAELAPERTGGGAPLFQAMFVLQTADEGAPALAGVRAEPLQADEGHAKFELLLSLRTRPDGVLATLEYAAGLWNADSAARMLAHFGTLLRGALARPDAPISALPLADEAERALLAGWSGRETPFPRATVDALFARVAAASPDAIALESGAGRVTYAELDARANRLARHLRGLGVAAGTRVGIFLERGAELVVATLATLKAGGAYVPLDPAYPAERLAFMLADTAVPVLVTDSRLAARLPAHSARLVAVDTDASAIAAESAEAMVSGAEAESAAYVMYTSGSTGRPKGIEVPHRAIVRLVREMDYITITPHDVFLQLAPASFDAATLEIWAPLLNGARLAIHPPEQPGVDSIAAAVEAHGVTILWLTTGLFHLMVDERIEALRGVRQLLAGGDVLSVPHARRVRAELPDTVFSNAYGPTENTTFTSCHRVERLADDVVSIPIGRPIANTRVHVLNAAMQPAGIGVPGELYAGGAGLALGYLHRPELTAEMFAADPFTPGARLYRTGDRVRWLADGTLEFLGRVDTQVKIRGFRIEPGEVEAALLADPRVRAASVVVRDDAPGGRGLVAYVVGDVDAEEVRSHLKARLPEYMLPAAVVWMDALPLTANGKTDRRALPAPEQGGDPAVYTPPRTPTEEVLAGAWAQVLSVPRVGAHDDFFALGGHSLLAARAVSRIRQAFGVEMPLRTLFEHPTVAALAEAVDALRGAPSAPAHPITRVEDGRPLPLSFAQERLWILDQMDPGSAAYNVAVVWRLRGTLNVPALERALTSLVARHEALRTVFRAGPHGAEQVILPAAPIALPVQMASAEEADEAARDEAERPFHLSTGPLLRVRLLRTGDDEHRLLLTLHHAVTDAWSLGIMHAELSSAYGAARAGAVSDAAPALRYADYAAWQRGWLTGDVLERQVAYWRAELRDAPALLELPADRPRPPVRGGRGARFSVTLDADLLDGLRVLGRREGATLYMTLLAAFQVLLARWSGQDDVVVGSPIAGRTRAETEGMVGFFVNSLALRARLGDDPTFLEALARARRATLDAYAHQDVPFERLVEELQPERALDRSPVFQVMFALQNADIGALRLAGMDAERISSQVAASKLDLSVHAVETDDGLRLHAFYATELFDEATAARLFDHFDHILRAAVAEPSTRVSRLPLLSSAGRARVVDEWNATARAFAGPATLHGMMEAQAARTPHAVAIVSGDVSLTYAELDARANRVARRLREMGVDAESRVAICLERSADTLAAILGVLKAGGAYVPIEPSDPAERVAWLLDDSVPAVVITSAAIRLPAHGAPVLRMEETASTESTARVASAAGPDSAAYVVYTSGSTGRPKGVVVEHRNIVNYVHGILAHLADVPCRAFATVSTFSADLGNTVVFPALCSGGTLHVISSAMATDADAFGRYARAHGIDCLKIVPSHLQALMAGAHPAAALPRRLLILGGEASRTEWVDEVRAMAPGMRIVNHYGPTETTVGVLTLPVDGPMGTATLPLGRPLPNVRVYVLDSAMQPQPVGVPGELFVGGAQVARGYLHQPAMTAERFVDSPFIAGDRLYRTGDRARWLADGTVEFLGRVDDQVKIRGFRVEPGEVAAALRAHPAIRDAAVAVRDDAGERRLVAYVVGGAPAAELRAFLAARLPDAMVPAAFVALDALPLTANGKLDRRALPAPEARADGDGYLAPRTPTEEVLAEIWAELLGVERVGADDGFFALGGHSLLGIRMVSRVRAALGAEVPLRAVFESATLATFSARVDLARGSAAAAVPAVVPVNRSGPLPLSFAQQRLWFLQQLDPASTSYNMPYTLRLRGAPDIASLQRALGWIVARHEALRTRFELAGDEPVQVIDPAAPFHLPVVQVDSADAARRRAEEEARAPFDLARGPLFRATLLRVSAHEHLLVIVAHHAVCDGWSLDIIFRELAHGAEAFAAGREPAPAPLGVQYADFAAWQRAWLAGGEMERQLAFWRGALAGAPAALELPTDRPRPAHPTNDSARHGFTLPAETAAGVRALARREGATPFMVLLAAFQLLLARYAGTDDVVVGAPVAGRTRAETEGLVGFFVNTLPLRARLNGAPGFRELLARVRAATLDAHAHQDAPLERIVEAAGADRGAARTPLFQALFVMMGEPRDIALGGAPAEAAAVGGGEAKFDLAFGVRMAGEATSCWLEYAAELWDADTMERMGGHFATLLAAALARPDAPVADLPMLTEPERRALAGWNATDRPYPAGLVHERIARQAARTPEAVALSFNGAHLTYAELDARANRLAHRLRRLGVGMETRVGLLMDRGVEMVVAIIATLKAGGAWVPLDPSYPADRLAYMVGDARAAVLLTQDHLAHLAAGHQGPVVRVDGEWRSIEQKSAEAPDIDLPADALAYLIYTSGSTGRPKGAMNAHRGIWNRVVWMQEEYGLGADDVVLQKTPFSFDVSVWEFLWPLMTGARLVVARPDGHRDPQYLAELIEAEGVTTLHFVPSMLQAFLDDAPVERCASVRRVMCSGEALPPELAERFFARMPAGAALHNLYGPTEAAVDVTAWACAPGSERGVPIGRPVANTRIHLLDGRGAPVPIGVAGELHIAGVQVGRGYLGRPALTAETFIPDPFSARLGARMYRTGDLARRGRDGAVDYLGRMDFQVKLRGFRIEPGEIEAALRRLPGVRGAAVLVREDQHGDRRLVGYCAADGDFDAAAARAALRGQLPDYMVPAALVALPALPLSPNGKLDRRALPAPGAAPGSAEGAAPRTPAEEVLAGIWCQVLQRETVAADDDFFALGGHSLLATRVVARVRQAFGVEPPLRDLFEAPTLAGLAARIERLRAGDAAAAPPLVPVGREDGVPASFAQQRLWFLDRLEPGSAAYALPSALRLRGAIDAAALERALSEIVDRHEALRTVFREEGGEPVQVVVGAEPIHLPVVHVADEHALAARLAEERGHPFSLEHGPLFRATLFRLAADDHVLLMNLHHVAADGWSLGVLHRELGALYGAFSAGRPSPLEPLPLQYADYAAWQRGWLRGDALNARLEWWTGRLRGAPALLEVPTDRPRSAGRQGVSAREPFTLPPELSAGLRALARREGATLYMVLLAAWSVVLSRWSGQDDVVVGSPIAGRTRAETEGLIGFFVNTLALRTDLSGDPTFRQLLGRVREGALGAYAHQELPFERLVEALGVERSLAHAPLYQAVLSLANATDGEIAIPGLEARAMAVGGTRTKVDLVLGMAERDGALGGALEYAAELWDAATAGRVLAHFARVLHAAAADSAMPIAAMGLMTDEERRMTVVEWNHTAATYPRDASVHGLVARSAAAAPHAVALAWDGGSMTYGELDAAANRLARHLWNQGVRRGARVAVCAERSPELVVALLAVLRAGGAFVPLDPAYPAERLAFMLADAGVSVLVAHAALAAGLPADGLRVVRLDADAHLVAAEAADPVDGGAGPDDVACVMFTSGSTGRPKGVEVTHRGIVRLSVDPGYHQWRSDDVVLQLATPSFDGSTLEIWGALLNGARLALFPERVPSLEALSGALERHGVTYLLLTAGLFNLVVDGAPQSLRGLRTLISAGDVLSVPHARRVLAELPGVRLVNGYGPTENAVATCWHVLEAGDAARASIPVGRPARHTTVYLLDRGGRPCPVGVPGELCTGGDGLARGYLGRPGMTAETFVPDPFAARPGARMYRTGDRARWLPDGTVEFLGRVDQQVKIRGFRVEPGEVEQAVRALPGVAGAAVAVRAEGGDRRLVAYAVPAAGAELTPAAVRDALRGTLPEHMLPAAVVVLDALPLNPVGKVDRAALPAPDWGAGAADAFIAPCTDDEARLAGVWAELLRVPRVGLHDDFFLLGGHSLLATQLVSRIGQAFGVSLPLRDVFERPTVAGLLERIHAAAPGSAHGTPDIVGRDAAEQLLGQIDDLSEDELDALLASLAADQDPA